MESRVQPKLLVRFGGLATRNPPTEEQEGRPGPTLHLIIPARCWSPGRPSRARREDRVRYWEAVAGGVSSEDTAAGAWGSPAVGSRWFCQSGGITADLLGSGVGVLPVLC